MAACASRYFLIRSCEVFSELYCEVIIWRVSVSISASDSSAALIQRLPWISVIPAYLVGVGVRPEHAPDFARR